MSQNRITSHFLNKFRKPGVGAMVESSGVESTKFADYGSINSTLERSEENLNLLLNEHGDPSAELKDFVREVRQKGEKALDALTSKNEEYFNGRPDRTMLLEVIVRTDGSRPSFLIKNDKVDFKSSPSGEWEAILLSREMEIKTAIQCAGRINKNEMHVGTGFLVARDLAVTNLHVLQAIGAFTGAGWILDPGANIDFGHEFKARKSVNRRRIKRVMYCGDRPIDIFHIDHKKLDLAIVQLESVPEDMVPINLLKLDNYTGASDPGQRVFTIGYPGDPQLNGITDYGATLLNQLFGFQFGCKRLAPGELIHSTTVPMSSLAHDASTLGGNSGSVIVTLSDEGKAFGLHYGGDLAQPRQNWGHILGFVLDEIQQKNPALYNMLK